MEYELYLEYIYLLIILFYFLHASGRIIICSPKKKEKNVISNDFRLPYKDIFGGVCAIPTEQFQLINGFSNTFWGWGAEDDDIAYRLKIHDLKISRYPSDVARYTMLKHEKQRANPHR